MSVYVRPDGEVITHVYLGNPGWTRGQAAYQRRRHLADAAEELERRGGELRISAVGTIRETAH